VSRLTLPLQDSKKKKAPYLTTLGLAASRIEKQNEHSVSLDFAASGLKKEKSTLFNKAWPRRFTNRKIKRTQCLT